METYGKTPPTARPHACCTPAARLPKWFLAVAARPSLRRPHDSRLSRICGVRTLGSRRLRSFGAQLSLEVWVKKEKDPSGFRRANSVSATLLMPLPGAASLRSKIVRRFRRSAASSGVPEPNTPTASSSEDVVPALDQPGRGAGSGRGRPPEASRSAPRARGQKPPRPVGSCSRTQRIRS